MSSHAEAHRQSHHEVEAAENARLGMWIFLGSETVFFATLIGSYLALHNHVGSGPGPKQVFDIGLTTAATIALLASSLTMALAVAAAHRLDEKRMRLWLAVTAVLGLLFVGNQAFEFAGMFHAGLTLTSSAFGSVFFTLTGFHGMHVTFGIVWILVWLVQSLRRRDLTPNRAVQLEVTGLYWAFVDVVWIVIFTVVYLLGVLS